MPSLLVLAVAGAFFLEPPSRPVEPPPVAAATVGPTALSVRSAGVVAPSIVHWAMMAAWDADPSEVTASADATSAARYLRGHWMSFFLDLLQVMGWVFRDHKGWLSWR